MKLIVTLLIIFFSLDSFAQKNQKESKNKELTPIEARIERIKNQKERRKNLRDSIPYFKFKYEKMAKENLRDLDKDKKRYEAGLAKLTKGTKRYKAREAEFKAIINKIKAQKIILIYAAHYKESLDAYDNKNSEIYAQKTKTCSELRNKYEEYTNESFPNFFGEYMMVKNRKKKRQASTQ